MKEKYKQQGLRRTKVSGLDPVRYAPHAMRLAVLVRDDWKCRYCGQGVTWKISNIDHVVAWKRHGATVVTNLVTACGRCNKAKGNGHGVRPRHLGKSSRNPSRARDRNYVTVPEYQTECKHNRSPNCLRQRCLEERRIPYEVIGDSDGIL